MHRNSLLILVAGEFTGYGASDHTHVLFFVVGVYANDYLVVMDNLTKQEKNECFVVDFVRNHFGDEQEKTTAK